MTNTEKYSIIQNRIRIYAEISPKDVIFLPNYNSAKCAKSPRIELLKEELFRQMPAIEADRAVLLTQSYMETEGEPIVTRRAKAFRRILEGIPVTIRPHELIGNGASQKLSGISRVFL